MPEPTEDTKSLADAYDHDDTDYQSEDFDPVVSEKPAKSEATAVTETENATPSETEKPASPPKGPDGRFRSQHIARLAKRFGIADSDYATMTDDEITTSIDQIQADREKNATADTVDRSRRSAKEDDPPPPAAKDTPFDWGQDEDGNAITDDEVGPALKNYVKKLEARLAALENGQKFTVQAEVNRQVETKHQKLDRHFDELGRPELFGKGKGAEQDPQSPEGRKRRAVLRELQDQKIGVDDPKFTPEFKKAYTALFGDMNGSSRSSEEVPDALKKRMKDWEDGTLNRPASNRAADEKPGTKKAVAGVKKFLRDNGAEDVGELMEGFLDD